MNQSQSLSSHPSSQNHAKPGSIATTTTNQTRLISVQLPTGWRREERSRPNGLSTGKTDVYYTSPCGRVARTKHEMRLLLGDGYDLSLFDWRSGKFSTDDKSNQAEDDADSNTPSKIARLDNLTHPFTRRTTPPGSFNPVIVTTHPNCKHSDEKTSQPQQPPPHQLFWEKRYSGTQAVDSVTGEAYRSASLPRGILSAGVPGYQSTELMHSLFDAVWNNTSPIVGQHYQYSVIEKNACLFINPQQPKIKVKTISDEDVRQQEWRVKELRRKLEIARKKLNPRYTCERHG